MSRVVEFPGGPRPLQPQIAKPLKAPRLVADEERVKSWYYALDWDERNRWMSLHEIKAATGVALTRLPTVLNRLGWFAQRKRGFPLLMFHGPFTITPLEDP